MRSVDGRLDLNCHPTSLEILRTAAGRQLCTNRECAFPSIRWYLHRRRNKTVDKLNNSLQIKIRLLQLSKGRY